MEALLTTAAGMLESVLPQESGFGASGDAQLETSLAFIDRHVANLELSPAFLEANLPFSRSSLYRLFEPLGGVASAILQRRLDRSMKSLLTGGAAKPRLRAIARDHGYLTQEQFSRAFRTRFDITPHQFYEMVQRQDHAGLAAQAQRAGFAHHHAWIEYVTSLNTDRASSTSPKRFARSRVLTYRRNDNVRQVPIVLKKSFSPDGRKTFRTADAFRARRRPAAASYANTTFPHTLSFDRAAESFASPSYSEISKSLRDFGRRPWNSGCPIRVNRVAFTARRSLPVFPD